MGGLQVSEVTALFIVLAVALVVWLGMFAYMWFLHGKIRHLERELRRREPPAGHTQ